MQVKIREMYTSLKLNKIKIKFAKNIFSNTNFLVILYLETVARVLGALEGADRDVHDEADVALLALVAVAVPVSHPATLPPRLLQVL
jgi:hypothetical protein